VPARIGNGDDPANNLYWGAMFGVKTFFKRSGDWKLIAEARNPRAGILERLIFKHQFKEVYLIADAYQVARSRTASMISSSSRRAAPAKQSR
jgi:hypothetical protein